MISLYNQHGNHLEEFEKDKKKINMINNQINEFKSQYNKLNDSVDNNDIIYNIITKERRSKNGSNKHKKRSKRIIKRKMD